MDKLASTREVLGEHLHQKIKEQVCSEFDDDDKSRLVSKMTGILLERSMEDILSMLTDKSFLQSNIETASNSLREEGMFSGRGEAELCRSDIQKDCVKPSSVMLSEDEIGEKLYQKVCQLEPGLAAQITGIMLEMGNEAVDDMLKNDTFFVRAFDKAKSCLHSDRMDSLHEEEDFSLVIYERAVIKYKNQAPKITGMIMELDLEALRQVVEDKNSLDDAITKAYSVLVSNNLAS